MAFKKQIYTIYAATNKLSGKMYVGFTQNWPGRIQAHKNQSKKSQSHFHCAIRKYGWSAFVWAVIFQSWDREFCLNTMEPHFIREYDTYRTGYNCTRGGGNHVGPRGRSKTTEHKKKLSEALVGRKQSNETRMKKSQSFTGRIQNEDWVQKRLKCCFGMVTLINKNGQTSHKSVEFYKSQYNGDDSEWCTTNSSEGKRRLRGVGHVQRQQ